MPNRGIELGEYRIRSVLSGRRAKEHGAIRAVRVGHERTLRGDASGSSTAHEHKLRDQVITATRMTPLAVFDEPELATFRRRILIRLRRALPELAIDDVYVSDFQLTVKSL